MAAGLVSILMPSYNCQNYIRQAIDSILNQTYTNFELLIADDCSTDNTKQIIDSYSDMRIKRFHNEKNLGYLKTSNLLFRQACGYYITFQDADDYSDLKRIEILVEYLANHPEIDCIGSNIVKISENGEVISESNYPLKHSQIIDQFLDFRIVMTGSALMIRRKIMDEVGVYNDYFDRIGSEDIYWYSLITDKHTVANLQQALYYYRSNPTSVSVSHKNPKAFVGHELIVLMFKKRKQNKPDFLNLKDFSKVDKYVGFLLAIKKQQVSRIKRVLTFIGLYLRSPLVGVEFTGQFVRKIIHNF
ncbi:MAG: glycosyltransferase [Bacteroidota bacterium]